MIVHIAVYVIRNLKLQIRGTQKLSELTDEGDIKKLKKSWSIFGARCKNLQFGLNFETFNMKLVASFLILALFFNFNDSKMFSRMTKVECDASMVTIVNPFCFLKSFIRNQPMLNFGFELKRKISTSKVWKKIQWLEIF